MRSRPRGKRGERCTPAPRLAEGRGQLHEVAPAPGVDRQDRRPRHGGCVLGLGPVAAEPARACVLALHHRAQRADRAARPPLGHRLARRQLEGELPLGRDRARGYTYGPEGFTDAQYDASARLAAWVARRSLLPIDRKHIIGHAEVPAPGGGRGGSSHHTDPGPHWNWQRYIQLVRRYAGVEKLSVTPLLPPGTLRGVVPWRAKVTGGVTSVEFSINGHVVWIDRRAPFAFAGGRGLNTTTLGNGRHVLQVHGIAGPGRYDIARTTIVVDNKAFALTSAGARPWTKVRGTVKLRVRPWGAKAKRIVFRVDGHRREIDSHAPFLFAWGAKRAKPGKHVLQVVATSVDGREAHLRIPLVVSRPKPKPKPKPTGAQADVRDRRPEPLGRPAGDGARDLARRRDAERRPESSSGSTASCAAPTCSGRSRSAGTPERRRRASTASRPGHSARAAATRRR